MNNLVIVGILAAAGLTACQPANIIATKWDSGTPGASTQTRCERIDMRDKREMDAGFAKYDGWKLVYISEYTTGNKSGTDGVACFEKAK